MIPEPLNSIRDYEPDYINFAQFLEFSHNGNYLYRDGDTITVRSYLPQNTIKDSRIRLARINAPELGKPGGKEARTALEKLLSGKLLLIKTEKDKRTFDRYIAEVYLDDADGKIFCVSDWMVEKGFATYENY